ncbi:MAG TPA: hypothetical protein DDW41_06490 [Candidatus Andersenbacteria bacterium]|nr:hypothetical protein [Candidatus Andersenbacteria bacterium]
MIPSTGTPVTIPDILQATFTSSDFEAEMRRLLGVKHVLTANSGTTSFYVILLALKRFLGGDEIIMPAYTAPSLVLPIKKAGLNYRLVDVSLETFNMDLSKALDAVTDKTMAMLCIHMFGLPLLIDKLREQTDVFMIEDAASSFGTSKDGKLSGAFGDAGFISFNRGKNLSTVAGGVVVTDRDELAEAVRQEIGKLPEADVKTRLMIYAKALGLSYAIRPWFYTLFSAVLSRFKYTTVHEGFSSFRYTDFQRSLGSVMLRKSDLIFQARAQKGRLLHNAFRDMKGIRIPLLSEGWRSVFNQFPLIIEDKTRRLKVMEAIRAVGLESTILYDSPIHAIYPEPGGHYPNAEYMAERLVLVPVQHYVTDDKLYQAVEAIAGAVQLR